MSNVIERTKECAKWVDQIDAYERDFATWVKRSKNIIKRYYDGSPENARRMQFNILWSNVQTLQPALYDSPPKPNIDRRFQDDDEIGLVVSQILERSVSYYASKEIFDETMVQCVRDRLLPGRGTAWVRYVAEFENIGQITEDEEDHSEFKGENVVVDYVHWEDFGHTQGRTWQEVCAAWRAVYMDREDLIKRFGEEIGKQIPLDAKPMGDKTTSDLGKKAKVYEIWDKDTKKVFWVHKDMPDIIDQKDDPLGLEDFWPFPKPIFATLTNDSLIPSPDYLQYQHQAKELDVLTARIGKITEALKISGVYDKSAEGVQRLLSEGSENMLIPIDNWAVFGEKNGLKGVIDYFPVDMLATVLNELYSVRDKVKQDLYEISGISDIIRGATNPNETLGAQELKGKYAGLRLGYMQKDVARFSRDLVKIMAEIISEHFSLDTIKQISGVKLLTEQEKQQILANQQPQMGMDGQLIPPQPLPEKVEELLAKPTWEQVQGILRDNMARSFRIDIETDSTIKVDQEAEKAARVEFLSAAGGFIQQAANIQDPEVRPILMEMLMFGVRGFKVGRDLETTFQVALDKMRKKAEQPQAQTQPDPAIAQAQADMQFKQAQMQADGQAKAAEMQIKQEEIQANNQIKMAELQLKERELALREKEIEYEAQAKMAEFQLRQMEIESANAVAVMQANNTPITSEVR